MRYVAVLMLSLTAAVLTRAFLADDKRVFLPGRTSDGHYQIELACDACHRSAFSDREDLQSACLECHGEELRRADDSHPRSKFTDPRNAERVAVLDARFCITCHKEHLPEATLPMGLTLARDYCFRCHRTVAEERPSHRGLPFDTCADSGCHNFHDNRALYEDFLVKHDGEPDVLADGRVPLRRAGVAPDRERREPADAPDSVPERARWVDEWAGTSHARAGVNCSDCHATTSGEWSDAVALAVCRACHEPEATGFLAGRHGMRLARGLDAMQPASARLAMRAEARDRRLGCQSCHPAHAYDTRRAAFEACLDCHDDEHSRAYGASPHAALWTAETRGAAPPGSGVSCATCHLPRLAGEDGVAVEHNQNSVLRPNEKMIREVCLACHGLGFTLDALADRDLVRGNFRGRPRANVASIRMATARRDAEREAIAPNGGN
jgi:hypothetical protein